jgi:septum formation inhibitor MinC
MMQGQQANARVTVMEDDDVKSAEAQWQPQGDYDVQFSMTTVESRFEALHSLGVNIEKAAVEQVVQLVKQAKASREAQRTAQAQATMAEEQAKAEEERRRAASAKEAAKQAAKAEVTSKAQRYMRKMSLQ